MKIIQATYIFNNSFLYILIFILFEIPSISYSNSIFNSPTFPGKNIIAQDDFEIHKVGPFQNNFKNWNVIVQNNNISIVNNKKFGLNISPYSLAVQGGSETKLQLALSKGVINKRLKVSFNFAFNSQNTPPPFYISLIDNNNNPGPRLMISSSHDNSDNPVNYFIMSNGVTHKLKPFKSKKSSALPRDFKDIHLVTIRLVADIDTGEFVVEQKLLFTNKEKIIYKFKYPIKEISKLEIYIPDNNKTGTIYFNNIQAEWPVYTSEELDKIISIRRENMTKFSSSKDRDLKNTIKQNSDFFRQEIIWQTNPIIHTQNGLFDEYHKLLPKLKELGITMIYFTPVWSSNKSYVGGLIGFPIHDGYSINPSFGDSTSFKNLVSAIHANKMKVMLDFAFHSVAWSSPIVRQHPEWLVKPPSKMFFDGYKGLNKSKRWRYMYRLDFSYKEVQDEVIKMMLNWVKEYNIDAIRHDLAYSMFTSRNLPRDYKYRWNSKYHPFFLFRRFKNSLLEIKPNILFLTESANSGMVQNGSDLEYSGFWRLRKMLKKVSKGKLPFRKVINFVKHKIPNSFPKTELFLWGLETHDFEPSIYYDDSIKGGFGYEESKLYMSLISTLPGVPIIFGGQEYGDRHHYTKFIDKSLSSTYKPDHTLYSFYKNLFTVRKKLKLFEGHPRDISVITTHKKDIAAFKRHTSAGDHIIILNHSDMTKRINIKNLNIEKDNFIEIYNLTDITHIKSNTLIYDEITVLPWSALILKTN